MGSWVRTSGWLKGYVKEKPKYHKDNIIIPESSEQEVQVVTAVRCDRCKSKNVKCYGKHPPVLYYKCKDCKNKFKVVEKD